MNPDCSSTRHRKRPRSTSSRQTRNQQSEPPSMNMVCHTVLSGFGRTGLALSDSFLSARVAAGPPDPAALIRLIEQHPSRSCRPGSTGRTSRKATRPWLNVRLPLTARGCAVVRGVCSWCGPSVPRSEGERIDAGLSTAGGSRLLHSLCSL